MSQVQRPGPAPTVADRLPADHSDADGEDTEVLVLTGINKSFPGVRALHDVSLRVRAGEVHALVGENGAGKSTLMAIAAGSLDPDSGSVTIGGTELTTASPEQARSAGIGIVRQDPALLPDLTVAENIALAVGINRIGGWRRAIGWSRRQLAPWAMGIDPRSRVSQLSTVQRFVVEIVKALAVEPRVLILDEPTEHLNAEEADKLFARVRETVAGNAGVVYISHRIPEVKQIADRITVLRDGQVRGTFAATDVTEGQIVELIVGRALETVFPPKAGVLNSPEVLTVEQLSGAGFSAIDLTVRAGEIVGLAGVQGNGQAELIRALAGVIPSSGVVTIDGKKVRGGSSGATSAGAVYVPADRHGEGIFGPLGVAENIVTHVLPKVSRAGLVADRKVVSEARRQIDALSIKTPTTGTPVSSLSGGNQQKVMMARALLAEPTVVLAEEPTQGVDAGARVDIYRILRQAAQDGAAVVVLSSDGVELEGLCDRVLIMSRGCVVRELAGHEVTEEAITHAALTSTTVRDRSSGSRGSRLRRWLTGDQAPAAVLSLIVVALGLWVGTRNPLFLSDFNLNNLLLAIAPLAFISMAQHTVVLGSGFDLSVGPLAGFLVVIASFWIVDGGNIVLGVLLMLAATLVVGAANGALVTVFRVSPVVATLGTYMALQGSYLTLRETPAGVISFDVTEKLQSKVGFVPVVTIVAVAVALALECALRWSRWGVSLRAVGSRADAAERLGIKVGWVRFWSYVTATLLVLPAGLLVMAQIGIGDGRPSLSYTLNSVTVVVLAGASIFGGRGSYIGVLVAAVLIQQVVNASPFLELSQPWSYWLPGLITIGSALLYAQLRRTNARGGRTT